MRQGVSLILLSVGNLLLAVFGTSSLNLMIVSFSSVFTPMIRGKIYAFQVKAVAWTVTGPIL